MEFQQKYALLVTEDELTATAIYAALVKERGKPLHPKVSLSSHPPRKAPDGRELGVTHWQKLEVAVEPVLVPYWFHFSVTPW
jgi:hypothetical protein